MWRFFLFRNCRAVTARLAVLTLLFFLFPAPAPAQAQPAIARVQPTFTDLTAHTAQQPAIASIAAQGIMRGATATQFNPDAANTRGDFAVSMQKMFNLPKPAETVTFVDVPSSSSIYSAVEAVAPYLGRQLLCPGCALIDKFLPGTPVTNAETAVVLTRILVAQGKVTLLAPAAAETTLASVTDATALRGPVRTYIGTAIQSGIMTLPAANQLQPGAQTTRANTATILDAVQKKFSLPQVQP